MMIKKIINKITSKFDLSDLSLCFVVAGYLSLVFNFLTNYIFYKNFLEVLLGSLVIFFIILTFFVTISFSRRLVKTLAVLLCFFSAINLYIKHQYGFILDEVMIANALDSLDHINDAVNYWLYLYLLFFFLLPAILICKIEVRTSSLKNKIIALFFSMLVIVASIIFLKKELINYIINSYSPTSYINSIYRYYNRFYIARKINENRHSLTEFYQFKVNKNVPQNINVVVVIGESLRADHLSINGYQRTTTPLLQNYKKLLNYRVQANFNVTTPAVGNLFSHRTKQDFIDIQPEKTLVDLMKQLGFTTNWFSLHSSKQLGSKAVNVIGMEADNYFFKDYLKINSRKTSQLYDTDLLEHLQNSLKNQSRNFIVLHSFGSHTHYFERSPKEFKKFFPECYKDLKKCSKEDIFNSYDNSVLFTDYFLNEVIKSLAQTNSIIFYISDHGSYLGENGLYANGKNTTQTLDAHIVPMFVYFSEKMLKINYYNSKFIIANSYQQKLLNSDYFFDSVLGCVGIDNDLTKTRNLNICNKNF